MSENNIYNGTFVLGNVSATTLSAGEGIKITTDEPGVIKVSNDETVLWETPVENTPVASAALSEPLTAFESFKVHLANGTSTESRQIHYLRPESTMWNVAQGYTEQGSNPAYLVMLRLGTNEAKTEISAYTRKMISYGNWDSTSTGGQSNSNNPAVLLKIVGVNRKQNGGN